MLLLFHLKQTNEHIKEQGNKYTYYELFVIILSKHFKTA